MDNINSTAKPDTDFKWTPMRFILVVIGLMVIGGVGANLVIPTRDYVHNLTRDDDAPRYRQREYQPTTVRSVCSSPGNCTITVE